MFNKDKKILNENNVCVTCSRDKTINVWNYLQGTLLIIFKGHENWVKAIELIQSSSYVVSVGEDKTIRIWDLVKKKQIFIQKEAHEHFLTSSDFHPQFMILLTGSVDLHSKIWKIKNSSKEDMLESMIKESKV